MITALARIEGMPVGVVGNNPNHLAGAIDSDGADKVARFLQLCDAFDLPVISLCDTPGMMVGPDVEATALVRHCSRLFVTGANLTVPYLTVVTRKAYGLGAQAMMGGSTKAPLATVAWPTGEFGGMGLEGAVRLGYRNELEAVADPDEREALFQQMVDRMYQHGKALNTASHFEIDDVIDPADTRRWLSTLLRSVPRRAAVGPRARRSVPTSTPGEREPHHCRDPRPRRGVVVALSAMIELQPIGFVRGGRAEPIDDNWDAETCVIELDATRFTPDSLVGLDAFSHVDVVYQFDRVDEADVVLTARRPRGRADWPMVGIFAQRGRVRPNRLGVTTCRLVGVERLAVTVRGLDAIDGTPVLDIKPFMRGFAPRGEVVEPSWAGEIMAEYW